ncbi:MAG: hypothetical protein IKR81_15960 [Victivallales bacterium]|nr:hypothetical protein [Victivallales bacterium]
MNLDTALLCLTMTGCSVFAADDASWAAMKRAALERPRTVIYNTDGCDALYYPNDLAVTPDNFKSCRLAFTENTEVTTISYCPVTAGFCHVTLPTQVGDQLLKSVREGDTRHNCSSELFAQGTDPLKLAVEYARDHKLEIFASFRMNDTHDAAHRASTPFPLFPKFKEEHPEVLFGSEDKRSPLCNWSAVDYAQPLVRQRLLGLVEETCQRYELDGVECDFMRHAQLFKSVGWGGKASQEELDILTEMMTKLRAITETEGRKRNRPILIAIRVPDSVEYCRAIGIDLEKWLQKGLVDLLITTSYFQLNPWGYSAELAHQYGVKYYASLDESRIQDFIPECGKRNAAAGYAARAMAARCAGADGIYLFNCEGNRLKTNGFGSMENLAFKNKVYYATFRGTGGYQPDRYLLNGASYCNMVSIEPKAPASLGPDGALDFEMEIGDDLTSKEAAAHCKALTAFLRTNHPEAAFKLTVNGKEYHSSHHNGDVLEFKMEKSSLKPGINRFRIAKADAGASANVRMVTILKGNEVMVYGKNQGRWRRYTIFNGQRETIVDNAYCLENTSTEISGALYHPLLPVSGTATRTRFTMRLLKADDPDSVVARFADGQFVEVVQFQPNSISLKYAGKSVSFDTATAFHMYDLIMDKGKLTLSADGKPLLEADLSARATNSQYALEHVAPGIGIPKLHIAGLIIGSLSGKGTGSALWKDVQMDDSGISLTDFAVKIDYLSPAAIKLLKLKEAPITSLASVHVQDGVRVLSAGVLSSYSSEGCRVSEDGKALLLEHDLDQKTQAFNLASALTSEKQHRYIAAEWSVQALRDGANGEPCFQFAFSPARPNGKGVWEFNVKCSTKAITTQKGGTLPTDQFNPTADNHFKLIIDTQSGEAILWCNEKLATSGVITAGSNRPKPFALIGDGSGNIAGQARLGFARVGFIGE